MTSADPLARSKRLAEGESHPPASQLDDLTNADVGHSIGGA
jgi:hypothetical protein